MTFQPSEEQAKIFDAVLNTSDNIAIAALAGTGKTTTLVELARQLPASGSKIFCAFNKDIVSELEHRLKGTGMRAQTFHSIGFGGLKKHLGVAQMTPDSRKYREIVSAWAEDNGDLSNAIQEAVAGVDDPVERGKHAKDLLRETISMAVDVLNFVRLKLIGWTDPTSIQQLIWEYRFDDGIDFDPDITRIVIDAVPLWMATAERAVKEQMSIDFTDMIYWPVKWDVKLYQHNWVFVDECQDLSPMQRRLIEKIIWPRGGRIVLVGDKHQCQPPETRVRMRDGVSEKRIDELQEGDQVITYDRRSALFVRSGTITQIVKRFYNGKMYVVSAGSKTSRSTENHKWLVRWTNKSDETYVSYLMRQGTRWRIGQTKLFRNSKSKGLYFGLAMRARVERADEAWILQAHESYTDALAYEEIVATRYGLPQMIFFPAWGVKHFTQDIIDKVYTELGDLSDRAYACLRDHGRLPEYPIYTRNHEQQRQGRTTIFETQACNLISHYMAVAVPSDTINTEDRLPNWQPITVQCEYYRGDVYSLNVERHHKYVADGLLTCNSIYAFAGADSDSFDLTVETFSAHVMPLTVTRRCATVVTQHAAHLVPDFRGLPDKPRGQIVWLDETRIDVFQPGDMVLCRVKAPLVGLILNLLAAGKAATILGAEIGEQLIAILDKLQKRKDYAWQTLLESLQAHENEQVEKYLKRHDEPMAETVKDQCAALRIVVEQAQATDYDALVYHIQSLFSAKLNRDLIVLATIHKSKGLEAERIFILKPEKLPLVFADQTAEAAQQETNLDYVARTRARSVLVYLTNKKYLENNVKPPYAQTTFDDLELPETAVQQPELIPSVVEPPTVTFNETVAPQETALDALRTFDLYDEPAGPELPPALPTCWYPLTLPGLAGWWKAVALAAKIEEEDLLQWYEGLKARQDYHRLPMPTSTEPPIYHAEAARLRAANHSDEIARNDLVIVEDRFVAAPSDRKYRATGNLANDLAAYREIARIRQLEATLQGIAEGIRLGTMTTATIREMAERALDVEDKALA